jgi:hypothetical protein
MVWWDVGGKGEGEGERQRMENANVRSTVRDEGDDRTQGIAASTGKTSSLWESNARCDSNLVLHSPSSVL